MSYKTFFNWSSGKDSALALYNILQDHDCQVDLLLTTVNHDHDRVTMHGVRRELILKQAKEIGISIEFIELPKQTDFNLYENKISEKLVELKTRGFESAVYGDIYLEDLKQYRDKNLEKIGLQGVYPLWQKDTRELMQYFIKKGFRAVVTCVKDLDKSFVGREIDQSFLDELPIDIDPCGENGEFHTFCYDGPIFKQPINYKKGDISYHEYNDKTGAWFCDIFIK